MTGQKIIMNYTTPPDLDDIETLANTTLTQLPEEIMEFCDKLAIEIEELADDIIVDELDLDDAFELCATLKRGNQLSPGVESKVANDDDVLILFRRPILDLWCETCDDLAQVMRTVMIEELGQNFDFSDEEIDEMAQRSFQGVL